MRLFPILILLAGPLLGGVTADVDPFIGTAGSGNTFPGALVPWGMVSISPHTDLAAPSLYTHGKPRLFGFGHVHLSGVGCPDLGNIVLLPQRGAFDHKVGAYFADEMASPGFYRLRIPSQGITAEMSATTRTSLSRYSFAPATGTIRVMLNLSQAARPVTEAALKVMPDGTLTGFSRSGGFCGDKSERRVYFALKSLPAPEKRVEWTGDERGMSLVYASSTAEVLIKVGISYSSAEKALINLEAENPGWDFEGLKAGAQKAWERELSKVSIAQGDASLRRNFYTALYHALIHPGIYSDSGSEEYTVYSLWDTYRTLHPLLILLYPEKQLGMLGSMAGMARKTGWLPKWELARAETHTMVGDPALPVIADSYAAGLTDFDLDAVWTASWRSATELSSKIRPGLKSLQRYGYIAHDDSDGDWVWGSVSTNLEYAYADWALARFASALGKRGPADWLETQRATSWKALYDEASGWLRPRLKSGLFLGPFDPLAQCCDKQGWPDNGGPGYVEGNAWHYGWFVPHDMPGLMEKMGAANLTERLQACMDNGQFTVSNEPDMAYPWLFNYAAGESWRTRKSVRDAVAKSFNNSPAGLPGNDDCGTTSAWLVWASLGLYPDCPGSGEYQLSAPLFEEMRLSLPNGRELVIRDRSADGIHGDFYFNAKKQKKPAISREALMAGGDLVFE